LVQHVCTSAEAAITAVVHDTNLSVGWQREWRLRDVRLRHVEVNVYVLSMHKRWLRRLHVADASEANHRERTVCVSFYMASNASIFLLALSWNVIAILAALSLR
jgi:hypothetical protein